MKQRTNSSSLPITQLIRRYVMVLFWFLMVLIFVLIFLRRACDPENSEERFGKLGARLTLPYERGRLDNQRLIRIYDFIRVGKEWEEIIGTYDICLTTQTSIERLYWLPQVLETWKGPVSLALFVVTEMEWLAFNIYSIFLERCYPSFRDHVTIHLAVPTVVDSFDFGEDKLRKLEFGKLTKEAYERDCGDVKNTEKYLNELLRNFSIPTAEDKDKLALKIVYPQNHLRNIARKGCGTPWVFSIDVDIIPRHGMVDMLQEFFEFVEKDECQKCAYVVPTFELDESMPFPKTKVDIINYFNEDDARQYHGKDYAIAQNATDYLKWTTTSIEEGPTRVSHNIIEGYNSLRVYEPFYLSSDMIPAFDERFLGYGRTRSSQFQEALLAGWKFSVLSNVFSIHWGLHSAPKQTLPGMLSVSESIRENQTVYNRELFEKIFKEMNLKKTQGLYD